MVKAKHACWRRALLVILACLPLLAAAQDESQQAFIELSASNDELYVQQQLQLTIKLYYTNNVVQGHLSDPEHPEAVIEQLGEQKQYRETLDGQRYRVVERNYVVFPQQPGRLQLPPVDFQGTARDARGHHYRVTDSAALFALEVKDIPDDFSGRTWLPTTELEVRAEGLEQAVTVAPGDNLTRTLTVTARGLPATTLPALEHDYPDQLRSYPEPEQRESSASDGGLMGRLQQTVALVPVPGNNGEITLPEMRIPWWDVDEDRERVAVLPARTLRLSAPVASAGSAPDREENAADSGNAPAPDEATATGGSHWLWPLLVAVLLLGWLSTVMAWWWQSRRGRPVDPTLPAEPQNEGEGFAQLRHQARHLDPAFFSAFPSWAGQLANRRCTTSEDALAILDDDTLSRLVGQWREHLFRASGAPAPDGVALERALKTARKAWRQRRQGARKGTHNLPDLYPDGLRP